MKLLRYLAYYSSPAAGIGFALGWAEALRGPWEWANLIIPVVGILSGGIIGSLGILGYCLVSWIARRLLSPR